MESAKGNTRVTQQHNSDWYFYIKCCYIFFMIRLYYKCFGSWLKYKIWSFSVLEMSGTKWEDVHFTCHSEINTTLKQSSLSSCTNNHQYHPVLHTLYGNFVFIIHPSQAQFVHQYHSTSRNKDFPTDKTHL